MGTNNGQSKAAQRRASATRQWAEPLGQHHDDMSAADAGRDLVVRGAAAAFGAGADPITLDQVVDALVMFRGTAVAGDADIPDAAASRLLHEVVTAAYEHGWQPADLVHIVRRHQNVRLVRLAAAVIRAHARSENLAEKAPATWVSQWEALDSTDAAAGGGPLDAVISGAGWSVGIWQQTHGANLWDGWHDTLALLGQWQRLLPLTRLTPPPSQWRTQRTAGSRPTGSRTAAGTAVPTVPPTGIAGGHDRKMLTRIRALLAKAEATSFAEEADAFTGKAQELMTRYAIDEALLTRESGNIDVLSVRVHIDNPYAATKAQLLGAVGQVNRVRAIWDDHHGIATIVGTPVDLEMVEMLFTSLLIQATRAMTETGTVTTGGHRLNRSPSFRRAFLLSYAIRIGERLAEAGERAQQEASAGHGAELVPVLARQSAAIEKEIDRLFPEARPMAAKKVNARGWHAGRSAADRAVIAAGQVGRT